MRRHGLIDVSSVINPTNHEPGVDSKANRYHSNAEKRPFGAFLNHDCYLPNRYCTPYEVVYTVQKLCRAKKNYPSCKTAEAIVLNLGHGRPAGRRDQSDPRANC